MFIASFILMGVGCSTEKDAFLNRAYHNTTARYNGYFNAKEKVKEGLASLNGSHQEDYLKVLPIYIYGDEGAAKSIESQMKTAAEKCEKVIYWHAMPNPRHKIKRKQKDGNNSTKLQVKYNKPEYCKWIDDNWLLMGKTFFYRRDFVKAKELFEYVSREYKVSASRYEAMLWLAKTHIENEDFDEADKVLTYLKDEAELDEAEKKGSDKNEKAKSNKKKKSKKRRGSSKRRKGKKKGGKSKGSKKKDKEPEKFPKKKLLDDLETVYADLYLRQDNIPKAIEQLEKAIEVTRKKKFRARLKFILAQLYQKQEDRTKASTLYAEVIKMNPPYEMAFYAKINRALSYDTNAKESKDIKAQLKKMLRDQKNVEYYDQIYYALADIEIREGDEPLGIDLLVKSTEVSVSNNRQKGLSFLRLGDIYFGKKNYILAQQYYDSTASFLPQEYEGYEAAYNKSITLNDLVKNLTTIAFEDSVQKLAAMDSVELDLMIENIIQKEREEEEQRKLDEELNRLNGATANNGRNNNNNNSGGGWYFYNQQTRSFGYNEFRKVWGSNRKLADNWRRSDKSQLVDFNEPGEDSLDVEGAAAIADKFNKEEYYKNIPLTDEKMRLSHKRVMDAIYDNGLIYKEKLMDNKEAIGSFSGVLTRYEFCEYTLASYYQLYRLYLAEGNTPKSDHYKNLILNDYPNSEYAQVIRNPDYKKENEQKKLDDEKDYANIYKAYHHGHYVAVLSKSNEVINSDQNNHYLPQYYFLKALAIGEQNQLESFEAALDAVVTKFPDHEVGRKSRRMLDILRKKRSVENAAEAGGFIYDSNMEHFFMMIFPNSAGSINDAKAKISNFNSTYYNSSGLKVSSSFIDADNQMILVKRFNDKTEAEAYFKAFVTNQNILKDYNSKGLDSFVITTKNYSTFYVNKELEKYKAFFAKNYLK